MFSKLRNNTNGNVIVIVLVIVLLVSTTVAILMRTNINLMWSSAQQTNTQRDFYSSESFGPLIDKLKDAVTEDHNYAGESWTYRPEPGMAVTAQIEPVDNTGWVNAVRPANMKYAGLWGSTRTFRIISTSTTTRGTNTITRTVDIWRIPVFQFGVFFNDRLAISNGPPMNFLGRIHSNESIYIAPQDDTDLDTKTYRLNAATGNCDLMNSHGSLTAVGCIAVGRGVTREDSRVRVWANTATALNPNSGQLRAIVRGDWDTTNYVEDDHHLGRCYILKNMSKWGGVVASGVDRISTPKPGDIQRGGFYDSISDVSIYVNGIGANNITIRADSNDNGTKNDLGFDVRVDATNPASNYLTAPLTDLIRFIPASSNTFYDSRERKFMNLLQIDLQELYDDTNYDDGGTQTFHPETPSKNNKVLYISMQDSAGNTPVGWGVRIINGRSLNDDLTIVSDAPVYVAGDYNFNNNFDASIICDSLTILSNSWIPNNYDARTRTSTGTGINSINNRNATNTVFNAAIAAADRRLSASNSEHTGGVHNFPRFLENWNYRTLTIRSSFISLWRSKRTTNAWSTEYYGPPDRDWGFDPKFYDPAQLPPATPIVVLFDVQDYQLSQE